MPLAGVNVTSTAINNIAESDAFTWLQTRHPHLAAYLAPFADAARKRGDKGDFWWELRACAYYGKFDEAKVYWPEFSLIPNFSVDETGLLSTNKAFFINADNPHFVSSVLNSKAVWFVVQGITSIIRGGFQQLRAQNIETLPIPSATEQQQTELAHLAAACAQAAKERLAAQRGFGNRILDLLPDPLPKGAQASLGDKLGNWWQLADFKAFQFEVQKRFKTDVPLRERNDWEQWFSEGKSHIQQLSHNIAATERSIDAIVYQLFGLNAAEIALVERAVQR